MDDSRAKKTIDLIKQALQEEEAPPGTIEVPIPEDVAQDDGIVQVGGHTYVVAKDGKLTPADYEVKMSISLTALEAHRLREHARKHRKTVIGIIREALSPITGPKPS